LLPEDILARYNVGDTTVCLELFDELHKILDGVWQKDWNLYYTRTDLMNRAYREGISIDLPDLAQVIANIDAEVDQIEADFMEQHKESLMKWRELYKITKKSFNIGSNKQLAELFVGVLGIEPRHMTEKGAKKVKEKELTTPEACRQYPSFAAKHLGQWGEAAKHLQKRRKRLLVLSQAMSAYWMATEGGGRIHPEVRIAGTRTNRVSGGRDE